MNTPAVPRSDVPTATLSFEEMETEVPELARRVRDRFAATGLCLVGTLRSDGWPRISPVEPLILAGHIYLGMMPRSTKSQDLLRDPRCLLHSTIADKDGGEGEVKLYGVAIRVQDPDDIEHYCVALEAAIGWRPDGPDDFDLWRLGIHWGVHQRFSEGGTQTSEVWRPGQGLRSTTRKL